MRPGSINSDERQRDTSRTAISSGRGSNREHRSAHLGEAWSGIGGLSYNRDSLKLPETVIVPDLHSSFRTHATHTTNSTSKVSMDKELGSIPLQPGETLVGEDHERPLSAPPPPGFGSGADARNRYADDYLWGQSAPTAKDDFFLHHLNGTNGASSNAFSMGVLAGIHSSERGADGEGHTSSFTNLAEVLGTGLVESMEDAMHDRNNNNNFNLAKEDPLSYHRMKRHNASRLMAQSASPQPGDVVLPPYNNSVSGNRHVPTELTFAQNEYEPKSRIDTNYSTGSFDERDSSRAQGFPWTLSVPKVEASKTQGSRQQSGGPRGALPTSIDIGMNVREPDGENQFSKISGVVSQRIDYLQSNMASDPTVGSDSNRSIQELERGVKNMWSPEAREFKPASVVEISSGARSVVSVASEKTEISSRQAESELQPFLWSTKSNHTSRTLAILHVSWLRVPDIRAACEGFGVLESFRADFASRGILFVSYYDIRSAQYAAIELQSILQRLSVMQGSNEEVVVRYCLSLSSSSQFDETRIVISNLPPNVNEYELKSILSSYGSLLSVIYQNDGSFLAEFQNLQDTKQALLELDSSQPWGADVLIEVSVRNGMERKRGRELLALIGRWRHGMARRDNGSVTSVPAESPHYSGGSHHGRAPDPWNRDNNPPYPSHSMAQRPQYVLGQDGRYTQVHVPATFDPQQPQYIQGPNGQVYVSTMPPPHYDAHGYGSSQSHHSAPGGAPPYGDHRMPQNHTPYYAHAITSDANSLSGRSLRSGHSQGTEGGDRDNRHLMMDLDMVEIGHDTRTSLMVRNIPNKYTQQMLLSEFEANGHGPGVIDFFYLPIDFKNRCNRGYAFINFVDCQDILAFHRRYYGKHWRTFNSDKICDITYARIQGKDAMLKRFENSALMEKDDEYKPLVFASDGPTKGQRLPFPDPSLHTRVARPGAEQ